MVYAVEGGGSQTETERDLDGNVYVETVDRPGNGSQGGYISW